jgi:hypothetical protein
MPDYLLFGLSVRSSFHLPGLREVANVLDPHIELELYSTRIACADLHSLGTLRHTSPYVDAATGRSIAEIWELKNDAGFILNYDVGIQFLVDRRGERIRIAPCKDSSLDEIVALLLGPVFGFVLRLRGCVCLHASAVMAGSKAIAFMGPSGSGKSTLAAMLASKGLAVLTDDILPLKRHPEGYFVAIPGYPRLKLFPDIASIFVNDIARLLPVVPNDAKWDKRYLELSEGLFHYQEEDCQLAAIYEIAPRQHSYDIPTIETLNLNRALISLSTHTFANYALDKEMRAAEFRLLSDLVERVPVRRFFPRSDLETLHTQVEILLKDMA